MLQVEIVHINENEYHHSATQINYKSGRFHIIRNGVTINIYENKEIEELRIYEK